MQDLTLSDVMMPILPNPNLPYVPIRFRGDVYVSWEPGPPPTPLTPHILVWKPEGMQYLTDLLAEAYAYPFPCIELGPGRIAEEHRRNFPTIGLTPSADPFCDIYVDLNGGIPLAGECTHKIYSNQLLEHIHCLLHLINECWRVLVPGGVAEHLVPRRGTAEAWGDPTHIQKGFDPKYFEYFRRGFIGGFSDYGIHEWTDVSVTPYQRVALRVLMTK